MEESASGAPWAFIAHKDGYWAGVAAANLPKREMGKFMSSFIADGFSIQTVHSRDEYIAALAKLKYWWDRPGVSSALAAPPNAHLSGFHRRLK